MKNTSKKLLLALMTNAEMPFVKLSLPAVELLLPELTTEGRRSLFYLLEKKLLIQSIKLTDSTFYTSTPSAREAIKALFPSLNLPKQVVKPISTVIVFKSAPKGDPQFRYLRNKILTEGGVVMSRGVYLITGFLKPTLTNTLESLYKDSIYLFTVGSWLLGTEQPIIDEYTGLSEIISSYSSISSELDHLLAVRDPQKGLNDKFKTELSKIYVRWFDTISVDTGISALYFPNLPTGKDLLVKLQTLLFTVI